MKRKHISVPSWGPQPVCHRNYTKKSKDTTAIYMKEENARRSRGQGGTAESRGNHQQCGYHRRATHGQRGGERRA